MPAFDDPRLSLPPGGVGARLRVASGSAAMRKGPDAEAERGSELLHGERVILHHEEGGFALVQNLADRYVGWVSRDDLVVDTGIPPTYRVRALRAFAYTRASIKSPVAHTLSLGATVTPSDDRDGRLVHCPGTGWIYEDQLRLIDARDGDPAAIANLFMHTPYLWGGRDSIGIDCSGLMQQAFGACGIALPRDSDMQFAWAGEPIAEWQAPGRLQRNDLVFWKGHVGIMLDAETFLHANGYHMGVAAEPLTTAISRIATQYGEPIGARRMDLAAARNAQPAWLKA